MQNKLKSGWWVDLTKGTAEDAALLDKLLKQFQPTQIKSHHDHDPHLLERELLLKNNPNLNPNLSQQGEPC